MLEERSVDTAARQLLKRAEEEKISTMFSRSAEMKSCPIGGSGACCRQCAMGPCRLVGKPGEEKVGVCGATLHTVSARNLLVHIATGASAHSDHGRDLAHLLIAVGRKEAPNYKVTDEGKLRRLAVEFSIETKGKSVEKLAEEVGIACLNEFGRTDGYVTFTNRAPAPRQKIWDELGIRPRAVDREIVEALHRAHAGMDQDPKSILRHSLRTALGDGWGGSMVATDVTDILFGTPLARTSSVNLGVLSQDKVNVIIHGHEPTLSEMIVAASQDPEILAYAKSKGAAGIQIAGLCCTANEILMRQGIPSAGNFLSQELAIITGAVEAMVVDIQCVVQGLVKTAGCFHTKVVTTSPKVHIEGATHLEFEEEHAYDVAKRILKLACDNFPNRRKDRVRIPSERENLVAGFSHEFINYMLGGRFRASFQPLNDNIINGRIKGVAGVVGCNNPREIHDRTSVEIVKELIANDVLVVHTGCQALASAKCGYLQPEAAYAHAGEGLRSVCEAVGIPPVLHLGSCVDNSRILTIATQIVRTGGLGEDISDLPMVGMAPEWFSQKALSIGTYFVASGAYVLFGVSSPVSAS
ncbi:MAG: anaerobic carbon-monoxide dehydrogenase catalytic subunit, partial [Planctomycetota bacterium]